jgi:cvfA/B/C family virulence factor
VSGSAELTVISWRDIPAQVTATDGTRTARVELPGRFLEAIDAAAMTVGLVGSDEYLEQWHRESRPCTADLERETAAEAERLEAANPPKRLHELVRAGGIAT